MADDNNNSELSTRRSLLLNATKGAIVVAFHIRARSWLTAAEIPESAALAALPPLDGRLVTDDMAITVAADHFGHIVHRRPIAVLQPGSVNDVVKMVRFAREHHIRVQRGGKGTARKGKLKCMRAS